MSDINIIEVNGKPLLRRFIRVQYEAYKDDPNFVPPLMLERLESLSADKNPYFGHAEVGLFIAERGGADVGRISTQVCDMANKQFGPGLGHFGLFEAADADIASALFKHAEAWLRERKMTRIQGPWDLSPNEQCGMLIDGFDTPPVILMNHHKPSYGGWMDGMGFEKAKDLYAYEMNTQMGQSEDLQKIYQLALRNKNISFREIDMKRWDDEIRLVLDIFNDAWVGNWGFVPLTEDEIAHTAKALKPLVKPWRTIVTEYKGEPVAFMITLPDINHMIRDLNGSLLPFGWAKLLWRLVLSGKETRHRCPLMGVKKELHGQRVTALMVMGMVNISLENVTKRGSEFGEMGWILEDNHSMRNILENGTGSLYKTYRIYEKAL